VYSAEDRGGLQEMEVVGLPGGGVRRGVVKKNEIFTSTLCIASWCTAHSRLPRMHNCADSQ